MYWFILFRTFLDLHTIAIWSPTTLSKTLNHMDKIIQPISIELLSAFPLPRTLEALPPQILKDFAAQYDLVKGYVKLLPQYQDFESELHSIVQTQIKTLNEVIVLLDKYNENSAAITDNLRKMDELYKEFLNYETYQYQLMSSNFNQNFLKLKFAKLVNASDSESIDMVKLFNSDLEDKNLSAFLQLFRQKRKLYHLLKEKLNRWDEERISGLI